MTSATDLTPAPTLWNPKAAAWWSVLFTPAFGAYFHARNADLLGRPEEAKANRLWFKASLIYAALMLLTPFVRAIPNGALNGAAIGLLVGWYSSLGSKQGEHIKRTQAESYPRHSWARPLTIAFACLMGYLAIGIALSLLADRLLGVE